MCYGCLFSVRDIKKTCREFQFQRTEENITNICTSALALLYAHALHSFQTEKNYDTKAILVSK